MELTKIRPFLKWPGGKIRIIERIQQLLPPGTRLIEPFAGSGAVFLNTNYSRYLLNDANQDLINLYQILTNHQEEFIEFSRELFTDKYNKRKIYYQIRKKFNQKLDALESAAYFLYLNRHGYNGLIRYNLKKREFNVPFGDYKKPYFPEKEMRQFYEKSKHCKFTCGDFRSVLKNVRHGNVVYCDPPYVPLSKTAHFTRYQPGGFTMDDQFDLAHIAKQLSDRGIPVLLSNHATQTIKQVYTGAEILEFSVRRSISCKGRQRRKVPEILALFA